MRWWRPGEGGGGCDLEQGARNGVPLHGDELAQVEMHPDAEHQQYDPELRQLLGNGTMGYEAGGEWPHHDTCQQIADDGRESEALREQAEDERCAEPAGYGEDEVEIMGHLGALPSRRSAAVGLIVRRSIGFQPSRTAAVPGKW
jgi:hypothetical protein